MSKEKKTNMPKRSSNHPILSLQKALDRAKPLKGDKYNFIPLDVLASRWNQKRANSYTLQLIAALSAFGLLETQGEKSHRKVRLSTTAHKVLSDTPVPDKENILKECALKPPIYNAVWKYYETTGLPQDDVLKAELVWGDNFIYTFTEESADLFVNNFKETISFAKLDASDIIDEPNVQEEQMQGIDTGEKIKPPDSTQHIQSAMQQKGMVIKNFEIPLGDGLTAILVVPYPLPKKKFDLLNAILGAYEEGIVSETNNENEEEETEEEID